jgi:heme A synthase
VVPLLRLSTKPVLTVALAVTVIATGTDAEKPSLSEFVHVTVPPDVGGSGRHWAAASRAAAASAAAVAIVVRTVRAAFVQGTWTRIECRWAHGTMECVARSDYPIHEAQWRVGNATMRVQCCA